EVFRCIFYPPEHHKIDVDDVLVASQHQTFLWYPNHTPRSFGRTHADFDDVLPCHLGQSYFLDRIGLAKVQAWWLASHGFAEAHDYAGLVWVDAEGKGEECGNGYGHHGEEEEERAGTTAAARHGLLDLVLTALEQVFEVARRTATAPLAAIAPRH